MQIIDYDDTKAFNKNWTIPVLNLLYQISIRKGKHQLPSNTLTIIGASWALLHGSTSSKLSSGRSETRPRSKFPRIANSCQFQQLVVVHIGRGARHRPSQGRVINFGWAQLREKWVIKGWRGVVTERWEEGWVGDRWWEGCRVENFSRCERDWVAGERRCTSDCLSSSHKGRV